MHLTLVEAFAHTVSPTTSCTLCQVLISLVVSIPACRAEDWGSFCNGELNFFLRFLLLLIFVCCGKIQGLNTMYSKWKYLL